MELSQAITKEIKQPKKWRDQRLQKYDHSKELRWNANAHVNMDRVNSEYEENIMLKLHYVVFWT